jgi:hypothetical protein
MQPSPQQSLNEPTITEKIQVVETDIKKLQADGASPRKIEALTEYKKYLEEQIKVYTNAGCIPKSYSDTGCIPPHI